MHCSFIDENDRCCLSLQCCANSGEESFEIDFGVIKERNGN